MLRTGVAHGQTLCRRDIELTVDGFERGEFAADAEFFFEPFHRFGPFERPDNFDFSCNRFAVAHLLDEVEELTDDGGDTAPTSEENDGIKGGEVALHATVGTVDEGAVGLVGPFIDSGVENFTSKAAKGPEDECHISVLLAVIRRKVLAAEGGNGERMVFEDRNARHAQVNVLAWTPANLGRNGDFDGVLWKDGHGGFFTDEPGHSPGVGPIEVEETGAVGYEPNAGGCS